MEQIQQSRQTASGGGGGNISQNYPAQPSPASSNYFSNRVGEGPKKSQPPSSTSQGGDFVQQLLARKSIGMGVVSGFISTTTDLSPINGAQRANGYNTNAAPVLQKTLDLRDDPNMSGSPKLKAGFKISPRRVEDNQERGGGSTEPRKQDSVKLNGDSLKSQVLRTSLTLKQGSLPSTQSRNGMSEGNQSVQVDSKKVKPFRQTKQICRSFQTYA